VTEAQDKKIADLYQHSSQETPPAHVDRAVMDRARKSVRRRVFAPFGDNRVAHGAMVGVVILSVLLLMDVPQQPDAYAPVRDTAAPTKEKREILERNAQPGDVLLYDAGGAEKGVEKKRAVPAAPRARFDAYEEMQELEVIAPEEEARIRRQQAPALAPAPAAAQAAEEPASLASKIPTGPWYMKAGVFQDKEGAEALKLKLTELGFKCEIEEATVSNTDIDYRVRVGPFADPEALDEARQKLGELGIEAGTINNRE
jgi:cell division protein FtsN